MRLTAKGQLTIPPALRRELDVDSETELQVDVTREGLLIRKLVPSGRGEALVKLLSGAATVTTRTGQVLKRTRQ